MYSYLIKVTCGKRDGFRATVTFTNLNNLNKILSVDEWLETYPIYI